MYCVSSVYSSNSAGYTTCAKIHIYILTLSRAQNVNPLQYLSIYIICVDEDKPRRRRKYLIV